MMNQWFCKYRGRTGPQYCIRHGEEFRWGIGNVIKSNLIWHKEIPKEKWGHPVSWYVAYFELQGVIDYISITPVSNDGCFISYTVTGSGKITKVKTTLDQARQTSDDIVSMLKGMP